ncbi:hypothetical protein GYMLUDRAFT_176622 [Collybiopsis luxurians FD-317 M1]|uniref:Uncharacterized protein n=1 Tax=Collybiopsis luxurians FD-317 M1 TaxID=944289 RepID=A0A0D0AW90_9AGAR|nr:hypothetical protein GYMLUDRAFT_176622 [Collybiopsis luxurians FD-317 M1]
MVADFVSADYSFLSSPDGKESTCLLFKTGSGRDGYMQNLDIIEQFKVAAYIVEKHYSNNKHVLIYDNATTHAKCEDSALPASLMPKNLSVLG